MQKIKIAVAGAGGKMGRRILSLASADPAFQITGALEHVDASVLGDDIGSLIHRKNLGIKITEKPREALASAQVLIDFSHPDAVKDHLKMALDQKVALVVGTTGLSEKTLSDLQKASEQIAILQSPNMSAGVNLLFELAVQAAKILDDHYDIEITETHHRMKKDAPSGTALELARCIAEAKGWQPKKAFVFGREGQTGERPKGTLAIHALRGGDIVGDHTVSFFGDGEVLEISHRATSRDTFAGGALLAAKFIAQKKKGLYNMRHVLQA